MKRLNRFIEFMALAYATGWTPAELNQGVLL